MKKDHNRANMFSIQTYSNHIGPCKMEARPMTPGSRDSSCPSTNHFAHGRGKQRRNGAMVAAWISSGQRSQSRSTNGVQHELLGEEHKEKSGGKKKIIKSNKGKDETRG